VHVEYAESVARVIAALEAGAPSTLDRLRAVSEATTFSVGRPIRSGTAEGLVR
jgi:hypothetical protein